VHVHVHVVHVHVVHVHVMCMCIMCMCNVCMHMCMHMQMCMHMHMWHVHVTCACTCVHVQHVCICNMCMCSMCMCMCMLIGDPVPCVRVLPLLYFVLNCVVVQPYHSHTRVIKKQASQCILPDRHPCHACRVPTVNKELLSPARRLQRVYWRLPTI
jgi:hypothetical protein